MQPNIFQSGRLNPNACGYEEDGERCGDPRGFLVHQIVAKNVVATEPPKSNSPSPAKTPPAVAPKDQPNAKGERYVTLTFKGDTLAIYEEMRMRANGGAITGVALDILARALGFEYAPPQPGGWRKKAAP